MTPVCSGGAGTPLGIMLAVGAKPGLLKVGWMESSGSMIGAAMIEAPGSLYPCARGCEVGTDSRFSGFGINFTGGLLALLLWVTDDGSGDSLGSVVSRRKD